jgi:UDP-galactopyranose mutase
VLIKEYPVKWEIGKEPYYPINTDENQKLYLKYKLDIEKDPNIVVGGRLGTFRYLNMDLVVSQALEAAKLLA